MPAAGMRKLVDPIFGQPSPYGLLGGCTEVVQMADLHEGNGTEFLSASCAATGTWNNCPQPGDTPNPASKTFNRPGLCSFPPVTVYAGVTCSVFGLSYEEGQTRALEQLRMGEQRALEEWFMLNQLCTMAAGNDLTPAAGAVSVVQGVASLEGWLADNYGGQGVLHIPAAAAALLSSKTLVDFATELTSPRTLMGNCLVLGSGYNANVGGTPCLPAPSCEAWLYITPPVRVRRDTPFLVPESEAASIDTRRNDRYALAETTFVVETACCVAASVKVRLCAE